MAPPVRRPPGSTVTIVEGPQGKRGEKGEPGSPGDPTSLLDVLTPGEPLTVDEEGNPASLGPVGRVVDMDDQPDPTRRLVARVTPDGEIDDLWIEDVA